MSPEELDAIEKACEAATSPPWLQEGGCFVNDEDMTIAETETDADAHFIANARQWVPALVARVKELEAEKKEALEMYWAMGRQLEAQRLAQETAMMKLSGVISEREACAKIVYDAAKSPMAGTIMQGALVQLANAIMARK